MLPFRDINPSKSFPLITITLIVVNVIIFIQMQNMQDGGDGIVSQFAFVPSYLLKGTAPESCFHPIWATMLTSQFLHGGIMHLLGNMLFLWIFGNNIEDIMGPIPFLIFYLLCGIIAAGTHYYINPASAIPTIGASGAISGILGAYIVRFPRAQIDTCLFFFFITVIRLPAIIVLGIWFLIQLASGMNTIDKNDNSGGVAFWAHIGGFAAGMILVNFFAKKVQNQYNYWK